MSFTALDEKGVSTKHVLRPYEGGLIRAQPGVTDFVYDTSPRMSDTSPTNADSTLRENFLELKIPRDLIFRTLWVTITIDGFTVFNCAFAIRFFLQDQLQLEVPGFEFSGTALPVTQFTHVINFSKATGSDGLVVSRKGLGGAFLQSSVSPHYYTVSASRIVLFIQSMNGSVYGATPDARFFIGCRSKNYVT